MDGVRGAGGKLKWKLYAVADGDQRTPNIIRNHVPLVHSKLIKQTVWLGQPQPKKLPVHRLPVGLERPHWLSPPW